MNHLTHDNDTTARGAAREQGAMFGEIACIGLLFAGVLLALADSALSLGLALA